MFHPWRSLRALGDDTFMAVQPTPGGKPAWWDPESDTFLIKPGMTQVERRCALTHELAHRTLGHSGLCTYPDAKRQNRRQERVADLWAAERLITLEALAVAMRWSKERDEVADELWVTRPLLDLRLETMLGGERMRLRVLMARASDD